MATPTPTAKPDQEAAVSKTPPLILSQVIWMEPVEYTRIGALYTAYKSLEEAKVDARDDFLSKLKRMGSPSLHNIRIDNSVDDQISFDLLNALWYNKCGSERLGDEQLHANVWAFVWNEDKQLYEEPSDFDNKRKLYHLPCRKTNPVEAWEPFIKKNHSYIGYDSSSREQRETLYERSNPPVSIGKHPAPSPPPSSATWPPRLYVIETRYILPVYDTYVETKLTIALTLDAARAQCRKQFLVALDRNFRGGQESISEVAVRDEHLDCLGTDFLVSLWNTCDRGGRADYNQALRAMVHELEWNADLKTYQMLTSDTEPVYKIPIQAKSHGYPKMEAFVEEWEDKCY